MEDAPQRAKHILAVYLDRGRRALSLFAAGDPDEATALLARRKAAFHNFCAVDHLARTQGHDLAQDPEAQALTAASLAVDEDLRRALAKAQADALQQMTRLRAARQKISRYHSGDPSGAQFTRTA